MITKAFTIVLSTISLIAALPAAAQDRPVQLASSVQLVVPADAATGEPEHLAAATSVVPSDQLVFAVRYRNTSAAPVSDLLIVNPVPASVRITQQSANANEVSVDGGSSWGNLSDLVVTRADGSTSPATVDDISHLRWKVTLIEPGQTGSVAFRAIVR